MNFLFGKKKHTPPTAPKAIDKLRETLNMLEKRENHLVKQITGLKEQAKVHVHQNNKPRALVFLKRVKLLEKELGSISGQKFNLDSQISTLMLAIINNETITAMKIGRDTLVGMESKMDPDNVADIMDDISENIVKMDEVSETLSRSIGLVVDEDELTAEMDTMLLQDKILDLSKLPDVPQSIQSEKEEQELQVLLNF